VKVVFSDEARGDLQRIADHIAKDSPRRALVFVRKLRDQAQKLAHMPLAFAVLPRFEHKGIRRRVYRDYLIFYRVEADQVYRVHILHGAQDYESLLFPQG
jgi:plasmid stabilization system protein ParE